MHDGVVVDSGDGRLPLSLGVQRGRVVTGHRDSAVGGVAGDDVVLDHVVVGRPGLVGQQYPAGVVRDEVAVHLGIRDGQEVHALPAVTGLRPLGLAFEVGRRGWDTAAQVVVHHRVVPDGDAADGALHPGGQDALAESVGDREALHAYVRADDRHTGEDGQLPDARWIHHKRRVDALLIDGRVQADQRDWFLDHHLLVVAPGAYHDGRPGWRRLERRPDGFIPGRIAGPAGSC